MIRRFVASLMLATPFVLFVVFGPPRSAAPGVLDSNFDIPNAETPIVAIRGQPLAEHEEPLPPGARVRFGSTRFRHPNDLSSQESVLVGRYLVTLVQSESFMVTDTVTGKRLVTQSIRWRQGGDFSRLHVTVSTDGRRFLLWNLGALDESGAVAQLWEIGQDARRPVIAGPVFTAPNGQFRHFVNRGQFAAGGREVVFAGWRGILAFDASTGALLRDIRTESQVLDISDSGNRFLTWSVDDPAFCGLCGGGLHSAPRYRFRAPDPDVINHRRALRELQTVRSFEGRSEVAELQVRDGVNGSIVAALPCPPIRRRNLWIGESSHRLSHDDRYVASASDSEVRVWHVDSGRQLLHILPEGRSDGTGTDLPRSVAFRSPDRLVVTGISDRRRAFDLASGREVPSVESDAPTDGWLADESTRVTVDQGVIRRRDTRTHQERPGAPGFAGVLMDSSQDGRLIAAGDATGRLDVWYSDGRLAATLRTAGEPITAIAF